MSAPSGLARLPMSGGAEAAPFGGKGCAHVALFSCRGIAAVVSVHHRRDPGRDERFRRVGGPRHHTLDVRPLFGLETREHVIREIPPLVAASDAEAEPGKTLAEVRD